MFLLKFVQRIDQSQNEPVRMTKDPKILGINNDLLPDPNRY